MGAALGQEQEGAQVLWTEDPEQVTLTCTPSPSLHLLIYKMGGQAEAGGKSMAHLTAAGQGSWPGQPSPQPVPYPGRRQSSCARHPGSQTWTT